MFHFIYKWLYERSQKRGSFTLPEDEKSKLGRGFGHYILDQSKMGSLGAYDLLNRRKRRIKWIFIVAAIILAGWLVFELIYAINFYQE